MSIVEAILANGFGSLFSNLITEYMKRGSRKISVDRENLKTDLSNNIEVAFNKCSKIKTIINDKPIDFLSIYVDQNFLYEGVKIDQFDLIDRIRAGDSYVVTGTGGGGKSMFMRYLWLSYFVKSDGKIPFFLELRQLNSLTHTRMEDFIYHSIIQTKSKISQKSFEDSLSSGEFILFFDGFDEISLEMRDRVEQWIISLKENNPCLVIVMTSRPMERFRGWAGFSVVTVLPLSEEQVYKLVEQAPFFEEDKQKLKKKIKEGLYTSHKGFLSNPLLAYMMLVTISYNPDIPSKMHLFYEMAFEALFHRHDLTKNGFKREFHSKIEKQDFIRVLSYFSLLTYHAECYEFSTDVIIEYLKRIKSIEYIAFREEEFLKDLVESICILKIDGLEYSFTHRSFQEYFAAYCIARVASRNIDKIFKSFAMRHGDQVLPMVYDMNVNLFREKYILPFYEAYTAYFLSKKSTGDPEKWLFLRSGKFVINSAQIRVVDGNRRYRYRSRWSFFLECEGDFDSFFMNILRIILDSKKSKASKILEKELDVTFAEKYCLVNSSVESENSRIIFSDGERFIFSGMSGPEILQDFMKTKMYKFSQENSKVFKKFVNEEIQHYERLRSSFDDIF